MYIITCRKECFESMQIINLEADIQHIPHFYFRFFITSTYLTSKALFLCKLYILQAV